MWEFVFEDSELTPSSKMLKVLRNGGCIHFANGNSRLRSVIKELISSGNKDIVVFIDVNPNNRNTEMIYNNIVRYRDSREDWGNVLLVPILCIEYYILKGLDQLGCLTDVHKSKESYKYIINSLNLDKASANLRCISIEKTLKYLLNCDKSFTCVINKRGYGDFYNIDCLKCENCLKDYTRLIKAVLVFTQLPVFELLDVDINNSNVAVSSISFEELLQVEKSIQEDYKLLCKQLGTSIKISLEVVAENIDSW